MAVTVQPLGPPITSAKIVTDADCDATGENSVLGTSGVLYGVQIDNTANGAASYLKLYNSASPTVGTTAPDVILMCPASVKRDFPFLEGVTFGTAISMACVTAGGTAGTTSPTSDVIVRLTCV